MFDKTSKASAKYKQESMIEAVKTADLYVEVDMRMPETKKDNKEIGDLITKLEELGGIKAPEYMVSTPEENQATIADPKTGVVLDITIDENNKVQIEPSIEKDVTNLAAPEVTWTITPEKGTIAKTVTINITITDEKNGIAKVKFQDNAEETLENAETTISRTYEVTKNGSYKFIAEGGNGRKITKTIRIENVYKPETVEIEKVANIGDFVNYSVEVDRVTYDKWRILHKDTNGHVEIVCYNGPAFTLGENDIANAIRLLNEASEPYEKGTYAEKGKARHLGTNPITPRGDEGYEVIHDTEYIQYYNGREAVPAETLKWIEQTHHETDMTAIGEFSTTNNTAKKKLIGDSKFGYSWIGSRCTNFISSDSISYFGVRNVTSSGDLKDILFYQVYSNGTYMVYESSRALAPVVSLKSGIKIEKGVGDGSEEKPWILYE